MAAQAEIVLSVGQFLAHVLDVYIVFVRPLVQSVYL